MRASDRGRSGASKGHNSIPNWSRWVRDMINADVPRSQQTRPYTKVFRPRPPKPRYAPPLQPAKPGYSDRQPAQRGVESSNSSQDLFSSRGATRPSSGNGLTSPASLGERRPRHVQRPLGFISLPPMRTGIYGIPRIAAFFPCLGERFGFQPMPGLPQRIGPAIRRLGRQP